MGCSDSGSFSNNWGLGSENAHPPSMNSKSEWNGFKIARLCVETEDWEDKKKIAEVYIVYNRVEGEIHRFRNNLITNARISTISVIKPTLDSRKRSSMKQSCILETPA